MKELLKKSEISTSYNKDMSQQTEKVSEFSANNSQIYEKNKSKNVKILKSKKWGVYENVL
jgi:hypothetical protein